MNRPICIWLLLFTLTLGAIPSTRADAQVFALQSANPEQVLETLRTALGNRARVDLVQQKLVVVGDSETLAEAKSLLAQIDRLPANLRLTLTENPPSRSEDEEGVIRYSVDKNSQSLETVEGAQVSLDYSKFHQQPQSDGWLFTINETPVAVRQMEMSVRLIAKRTARITMAYTRYENQERKVYGRIVTGELGHWIPLLPQLLPQGSVSIESEGTTYTSGNKPGEQLYLRIDRVFPSRSVAP